MDFFRFLLANSFIQSGLFLILFTMIFFHKYPHVHNAYIDIVYLLTGTFFFIGLLQELLFVKNKKLYAYKELAKLLIYTRKIERGLENIGGKGKGMYEKAQSLQKYLPQSLLEDIFFVAEARNNAIHGSSKIDEYKKIIDKAKNILKTIKKMENILIYGGASLYKRIVARPFMIFKVCLVFLFFIIIYEKVYIYGGVGAFLLSVILVFYVGKKFVFYPVPIFTVLVIGAILLRLVYVKYALYLESIQQKFLAIF